MTFAPTAKLSSLFLLPLLLLFGLPAQAQVLGPEIIVNGEFSNPNYTGGTQVFPAVWVTQGNTNGIHQSATRSDGTGDNQYYPLGGWNVNSGGSIYQDVTLVPGATYQLRFHHGFIFNNGGVGGVTAESAAGNQTIATLNLVNRGAYGFVTYSFVANHANTRLRFTLVSLTNGDIDWDIDAVSLKRDLSQPDPTNANTTISATGPVAADGSTTSTVTVQLADGNGGLLSASGGTVLLSSTGNASVGAVTDNGDGTYTATVTNTVAETVMISGTLDGVAITDTADIEFTPFEDYSDAPSTYGDAIHIIDTGVRLGTLNDAETGSLASSDASGDGADDDGITIPALNRGATRTITAAVNGAGGFLQGWIDFDGLGTFGAGEQIATNIQDGGTGDTDGAANGSISIAVPIPSDAVITQTFARFRWSTTSGLNATTAAGDGEAEDYAVTIGNLILANDDDFTGTLVGTTGGATASVFINSDSLNGVAFADGLVIATIADDDGLTSVTIGADGTLTIPNGTTSGPYDVEYQICEAASATNCDRAIAKIIVAPVSDLMITKTNTPGVNGNVDQTDDTVTSGASTTYTLTVTNNGPDSVTGALVTDTPTAGLTCTGTNAVTITGDGIPTGSFMIADLTGAGISLGTLADGESAVLTYSCLVG